MNELTRVAILGTAQSPEADRSGSGADELVAKLTLDSRERALLLRAGAHAALQRAGRKPLSRPTSEPVAAADTLATCGPRLGELVRSLLESNEPLLLAEALQRMAAARLRLPHELLPLALQQSDSARRELLKPLLGARGAWLARHRPERAWALAPADGATELPADLEQRWLEGSAAERRSLFAVLRRLAPERARELLQAAWKEEKADQRAAFVQLLGPQLSAADEPLLVGMSNDRSSSVRSAAAHWLWRLPGSELAQRMLERVRRFVSFEAGGWKVTLPPETFDPSWERDGILETYSSERRMGKRQGWILQLMAAVPADTWLSSGATPQQLIATAQQHEFRLSLLDGLTQSVLWNGSSAWYAPLWDHWTHPDRESTLQPHPSVRLTAHLPPEALESRAAQMFASDNLVFLMIHLPRPWPDALAQTFLASLTQPRPALTEVLRIAAHALPLSLLNVPVPVPDLSSPPDYPQRAFSNALDHFLHIFTQRRTILTEIPQ